MPLQWYHMVTQLFCSTAWLIIKRRKHQSFNYWPFWEEFTNCWSIISLMTSNVENISMSYCQNSQISTCLFKGIWFVWATYYHFNKVSLWRIIYGLLINCETYLWILLLWTYKNISKLKKLFGNVFDRIVTGYQEQVYDETIIPQKILNYKKHLYFIVIVNQYYIILYSMDLYLASDIHICLPLGCQCWQCGCHIKELILLIRYFFSAGISILDKQHHDSACNILTSMAASQN